MRTGPDVITHCLLVFLPYMALKVSLNLSVELELARVLNYG